MISFLPLLPFVLVMLPAEEPRPKTLIEFGWDEPDTAYLRGHAAAMARSPFDGTVFHANVASAGGKVENFAWIAWGRRAVVEAELQGAIDDLEAAEFGRFRHNFLRFNTTPADLDWFDDFAPVLANARLAGRLARAGRCRGILLDTEQYEKPLFDYRKQRDAKSKGFDEYAEQARRRGRGLVAAFQDECPGLVVLMTFGPSLPLSKSDGGRIAEADREYGLLAPFSKGLIEGARGGTTIVDGHESSYGYRSREQFARARGLIRAEPGLSAGFGLWLDYDWRERGWDEADPSRNYFTPETFGASLRAALELTDEFVWIYAETPRWWTPDDKPIKLPAAYGAAIRK